MQNKEVRLKNSTLFYYSVTEIPVMMGFFPAAVFIPRFYASDVGVPLALVGTYILLARIVDVITDPLMGFVSDRVRTPWGQRKPWVLLSAPVMMLAIYMLFMPPEGAGGSHMLFWMLVLGLGQTMVIIPYWSWGAELSKDYNERSRITGWRAQAGIVGNFATQFIPIMAAVLFAYSTDTKSVLHMVGITIIILMPICVLITVSKVPEPVRPPQDRVKVMDGLKLMITNGPFLRLVIAFMIGQIGLNITTPLYLFFLSDVLGAEDKTPYILSIYMVTSFASVPFWVWLSTRISKHRAYVCAFALIAFAHPFYLLLGEGDVWWMIPVTLLTGFASGGFSQMLPSAMKADVIDYDTLRTGENRAALFFSAWSFAQKSTASIGAAIAMFGLALLGFNAEPGAVNGPGELFGLRFLFSAFPSIFFLGGALIIWNFPITPERQAEIRAEIEARAAKATSV
ncbi:MAG: MFS transporter [Gammaproteobacteria bacterium]|nr:MFS transporter [Gammaproteobacteria bacterium]MBT4493026.1 MFS transporter [Gammaproteobacteria bacterium]MBT7371237.1 MFS transporter [Gammaproteobacteria bacterium]